MVDWCCHLWRPGRISWTPPQKLLGGSLSFSGEIAVQHALLRRSRRRHPARRFARDLGSISTYSAQASLHMQFSPLEFSFKWHSQRILSISGYIWVWVMRNIALVREAVDPGAAANEVHQAIRASPIPSNCFQHNIMISYNTLVQAHRTLTTHVHLPLVCFSIAHSKGPTRTSVQNSRRLLHNLDATKHRKARRNSSRTHRHRILFRRRQFWPHGL